MTKKDAFLGIDNGTQGLTVLLVEAESLQVIATGEATYGYVPNLDPGCYEQVASDWEEALKKSMDQIRSQFSEYQVLAIGIAGQMHGQVLVDASGHAIGTVRLWCDARNQAEATELAELFGVAIPKRSTIARWLWTIRNQPSLAKQCDFMTTPAGWLAYKLTNAKTLGIGDASGMFPMDSNTLNYHTEMLDKFDTLVVSSNDHDPSSIPSIRHILPKVVRCGQDAGVLTPEAAAWLGLPPGIPVAAAEGDQPAALAGSLIGRSGMVSCSFGTSVCANLVGSASDPPINSSAIDHFCDPNGQPIYMVWLRNGTTFFNSIVESYGGDFSKILPQVLEAPPDCGGMLALPFMDDEPGLHVHHGGTAMILGWNPQNNTPGNACKAALLSTMFNLKQGTSVLQKAGVATTELILTGGLTKTPECGQILADAFDRPVRLLDGAEEGCSWGAAVLAKYRHIGPNHQDWPTFLESIAAKQQQAFQPNPEAVAVYEQNYQRYQKLLALEPQLQQVVVSSTLSP
jgi:sugar (pentulose or hexulose) kinase